VPQEAVTKPNRSSTLADYQSRTDVNAPAQHVFGYLADIANLPMYFERMTSAEPAEGDAVHVTADLGDRQVEGEAWFTVDHEARTLSWGSEGPNDYHGRLEVSDASSGAAAVTVTLSTSRADGPEIQQGLDETVANVKRVVEGSQRAGERS
jgi:uncharacterized membrane protein